MKKIYKITWRTPLREECREVACDNFNDFPQAIFENVIKISPACPVTILKIELLSDDEKTAGGREGRRCPPVRISDTEVWQHGV